MLTLFIALWAHRVHSALPTDGANVYYCPEDHCLGNNGKPCCGPQAGYVTCYMLDDEADKVVSAQPKVYNANFDKNFQGGGRKNPMGYVDWDFDEMLEAGKVPEKQGDYVLATKCCNGKGVHESCSEEVKIEIPKQGGGGREPMCRNASDCKKPKCGDAFCVRGQCLTPEIQCDQPRCPNGKPAKPIPDSCCKFEECPKSRCPKNEGGKFGICVQECDGDEECKDGLVCCANGCGYQCVKPVDDGGPNWGNPKTCPVKAPEVNGKCSTDMTCKYGKECCCNKCHHSLQMECEGGNWSGFYTDACMQPNCPEETCKGCVASGRSWQLGKCNPTRECKVQDVGCAVNDAGCKDMQGKMTCYDCVKAGRAWQVGECNKSDECEVQDVGCYRTKDLCDKYYEEQKNAKDCKISGDKGLSCEACLDTNDDCVYDTTKKACFSGANMWFRPKGVAEKKEECKSGNQKCKKTRDCGKNDNPCEEKSCVDGECLTAVMDCKMPEKCKDGKMPMKVPGKCCETLPCGVTDKCYMAKANKKTCKNRGKQVNAKCKFDKKSGKCGTPKIQCKRLKKDACAERDDCRVQSKNGKFKKCVNNKK